MQKSLSEPLDGSEHESRKMICLYKIESEADIAGDQIGCVRHRGGPRNQDTCRIQPRQPACLVQVLRPNHRYSERKHFAETAESAPDSK